MRGEDPAWGCPLQARPDLARSSDSSRAPSHRHSGGERQVWRRADSPSDGEDEGTLRAGHAVPLAGRRWDPGLRRMVALRTHHDGRHRRWLPGGDNRGLACLGSMSPLAQALAAHRLSALTRRGTMGSTPAAGWRFASVRGVAARSWREGALLQGSPPPSRTLGPSAQVGAGTPTPAPPDPMQPGQPRDTPRREGRSTRCGRLDALPAHALRRVLEDDPPLAEAVADLAGGSWRRDGQLPGDRAESLPLFDQVPASKDRPRQDGSPGIRLPGPESPMHPSLATPRIAARERNRSGRAGALEQALSPAPRPRAFPHPGDPAIRSSADPTGTPRNDRRRLRARRTRQARVHGSRGSHVLSDLSDMEE